MKIIEQKWSRFKNKRKGCSMGSGKKAYLAVFYYIGFYNIVNNISYRYRLDISVFDFIGFDLDKSKYRYCYKKNDMTIYNWIYRLLTILILLFFTGLLPIPIDTDIDKTDRSIYNWTYRHDFTGTDIVTTNRSNFKCTYQFCLYRFPLNQVALTPLNQVSLTTPRSGCPNHPSIRCPNHPSVRCP
jgi:hypothetical protein